MNEATSLTPLGHQILEHWKRHRPTMVATLDEGNQLQQAVFAAQELTGNLLYELTVSPEDGLPDGVGDRDEGMGVSPGRGGPAPAVVRSSDPRPDLNPCPRSPHNPRPRNRRGQPQAESSSQSRRNPHAESS